MYSGKDGNLENCPAQYFMLFRENKRVHLITNLTSFLYEYAKNNPNSDNYLIKQFYYLI